MFVLKYSKYSKLYGSEICLGIIKRSLRTHI
nr:MAG TPA: hypothetical protein [Caudoviricetes sp.]